MKPIIQKLSQDLDYIVLHVLSDSHIGDKLFDVKHFTKEIDEIKADDHAYVILAGDLINNSTTQSIGDTYAETVPPMEQLQTAIEFLEPIRKKILAVVGGNHEFRSYKTDGIDLTNLICTQLQLPDLYRPEGAYIYLKFGQKIRRASLGRRQGYSIYVTHGSRGGRKVGGKANALADEALICDADLYICGHTHAPMIFKDSYYRMNPGTCALECVERLYVNTAASLDYGGYSQKAGYQPASKSNPTIWLSGKQRELKAKM